MTKLAASCPCGSEKNYSQCCQPALEQQRPAQTAEALMRSRYSAFVKKNLDYLLKTLHPSRHHVNEKELLQDSFEQINWLGLEVISKRLGSENDQRGEVEFIARYAQHNQLQQLHERSRFICEKGHWYYLDGDIIESQPKLPGRNDPCWCNSHKKFKKCHGA